MSRAAILGAGSWGTALAIHLARTGKDVTLWARGARAEEIAAARENTTYLPGHRFPELLEVTGDLKRAVGRAAMVLFVTPAQASRGIYRDAALHMPSDSDLVIASKGIEQESRKRLSQVMAEMVPGAEQRATVLSGPSFAAEVMRGDPTAVVVAGSSPTVLRRVQEALSGRNLRVYRNEDVAGVELAGALKNVIALATGITEGLGLGFNTRAALMTRGLAEMTRLGVALGGREATFSGLAGTGDLILTCTGELSRNRAVGMEIGRGRPLDEILKGMRMVAEGVATTRATVALAAEHRIDMPIATQVHAVLFERRPPAEAVADLLSRPLKEEA